MPDTRDRFYAAAAAHPELTGIWLRAAGIELVGRDGGRETVDWARCERVAWAGDHCTVEGEGLRLQLDGRFGNWSEAGRAIAVGLDAVLNTRTPRQPTAAGAAQPGAVSPSEIQHWLGLGETGTRRVHLESFVADGLRLALSLTLVAAFVIAVSVSRYTTELVLGYLVLSAAVWCVCTGTAVATIDETGITVRRGPLQRHMRHYPWAGLQEVHGYTLYFAGRRAITLPAAAEAIVVGAARLRHAADDGLALPASEPVPDTALSRFAAAQEVVPATALSRTPRGDDA